MRDNNWGNVTQLFAKDKSLDSLVKVCVANLIAFKGFIKSGNCKPESMDHYSRIGRKG